MSKIVINTELNNSGFEKGYKEAEAAAKRFVRTAQDTLGNGVNKAMAGVGKGMADRLSGTLKASEDRIERTGDAIRTTAQEIEASLSNMSTLFGDSANDRFNEKFGATAEDIARKNEESIRAANEALGGLEPTFQRAESNATNLGDAIVAVGEKVKETAMSSQEMMANLTEMMNKPFGVGAEDIARQNAERIREANEYLRQYGLTQEEMTQKYFTQRDAIDDTAQSTQAVVDNVEQINDRLGETAENTRQTANEVRRMPSMFAGLGARIARTGKDIQTKIGGAFTTVTRRMRTFSFGFNRMAVGIERSINRIKNLLIAAFVFNVVRRAFREFREYIGLALNDSERFNTALQQVKHNLASAFQPILQVIVPALTTLMEWLSTATAYVLQFMAAISGKSVKSLQNAATHMSSLKKETEGVGKAAKGALSGLDAISKVSFGDDSGGGSGSPAFTPAEIEDREFDLSWWDRLKEKLVPVTDALSRLKDAMVPFKDFVFTGAKDFYNNFLVPVGNWVIGEGLPRFFDILSAFFNNSNWSRLNVVLSDFFTALSKLATLTFDAVLDFFDFFIRPMAEWAINSAIPVLIQGLTDLINKVNWQRIKDNLIALYNAVAPFATKIGDGLLWFYQRVLVPLGAWIMNEAVPRLLKILEAFFRAMSPIIDVVGKALVSFWNSFLQPLAKWAGGVVVTALDLLADALFKFAAWAEDNPDKVRTAFEGLLYGLGAMLALKGLGSLPVILNGIAFGLGAIAGKLLLFAGGALVAGIGYLTAELVKFGYENSSVVKEMREAEAEHEEYLERLARAYERYYGEATISVQDFQALLGDFTNESTINLLKINESLTTNADIMRGEFDGTKVSLQGLLDAWINSGETITDEAMPQLLSAVEGTFEAWRELNNAEMEQQLTFWENVYLKNDGVIDRYEQEKLDTIRAWYETRATETGTLEEHITTIIENGTNEQGELLSGVLTEVQTELGNLVSFAEEQAAKARAIAEEENRLLLEDIATGRLKVTEETYDNYISAVKENESIASDAARREQVLRNLEAEKLLDQGLINNEEYQGELLRSRQQYAKDLTDITLTAEQAMADMAVAITGSLNEEAEVLKMLMELREDETKSIGDLKREVDELNAIRELGIGLTQEDETYLLRATKALELYNEQTSKRGDVVGRMIEEQEATLQVGVDQFVDFCDKSEAALREFENTARLQGANITRGLSDGLRHGNEDVMRETKGMIENIKDTLDKSFEMHSPSKYMERKGEDITEGMRLGIVNAAPSLMKSLTDLIDDMCSIVAKKATSLVSEFKTMFEEVLSNFDIAGSNMSGGMSDIMSDLSDTVTKQKSGVEDAFKAMYNSVSGATEQFANSHVKAINSMTSQTAKQMGALPDAPKINVPSVQNIRIPRLATGAIIPPNREFLAILGDQKSGNNIEAPEDLIRKIVREEGGANDETNSLLRELITAVKTSLNINVDGDVLSRAVSVGQARSNRMFAASFSDG